MATQQNNGQEQDLNHLRKVRREKLAELQANGQNPFEITKYDVTHHSQEVKDNFNELEGKHVVLAGRMMSKRVMGKASFCNVQDLQGNIQSYVARDSIGEEEYKAFKKMDIGDIVGLEGEVFKTKTGEISIHASAVKLLSKSLQILPEKFHGLTNTDMRYRQRYVDLIMNPEVKDTFIKRSQIVKEIRSFLDGRGFMEVETPVLVANAGGANARPFQTHFNALDEDVNLRISLELYLKRLIVGGLERVYEIGRVFRNEGTDTKHNPEFTLLEIYQAFTNYEGMMELTETMFREVARKVLVYVMGNTLKLLHPFMPFITEEIWQALPHEGDFLIKAKWPEYREELHFKAEEDAMETVKDAIAAVRARRAEMNVPPSKKAQMIIVTKQPQNYEEGRHFITRMAYGSDVTVSTEAPADLKGMVTVVTHDANIYMPLSELVDLEKELERIAKEREKAVANLERIEKKLSNESFVSRAPEAVVNAEREKADKARALIEKLDASAAAMKA